MHTHTHLSLWRAELSLPFLTHKIGIMMVLTSRANEYNILTTVLTCVPGEQAINVFFPITLLQVDLQGIKAKFQEKYQKSLSDMVRSDTSGDFQKLLVALLC